VSKAFAARAATRLTVADDIGFLPISTVTAEGGLREGSARVPGNSYRPPVRRLRWPFIACRLTSPSATIGPEQARVNHVCVVSTFRHSGWHSPDILSCPGIGDCSNL
jgi:hypothetical protein